MGEKMDLAPDAEYFLTLQTQTGWGRVLARFAAWIGVCEGWRVLDVGCGPGLLPALLAQRGATSFGIDLDPEMFGPTQLHPDLAMADAFHLPFPKESFDLVTASNLLFMVDHPPDALAELVRVTKCGANFSMLNPSKMLTIQAATELADRRGLTDLARTTLINWAARAEANFRWSDTEIQILFDRVGLELIKSETIMGPGFARLALGKKQ